MERAGVAPDIVARKPWPPSSIRSRVGHGRARRRCRDRGADTGLLAAACRAHTDAGRARARAAEWWPSRRPLGCRLQRRGADGHRPGAHAAGTPAGRGTGGQLERATASRRSSCPRSWVRTTRYVSIARSDLASVIHAALEGGAETVFGDSVRALDDDGDSVHVTFESGTERGFDLVIGVDGLHSQVRRLAFGPQWR